MVIERPVCPENDALVDHMRKWWIEFSDKNPLKCTDNLQHNVNKALANICRHESHISTLKQFSKIKGIGKWISNQMRNFFKTDSSENDCSPTKGKKKGGNNSYIPRKNSAPYALLITLYRQEMDGVQYMRKQELIDAAEASGLSQGPIAPEKGKGKPSHIGSSAKEWYSGWSGMSKLLDKGLVGKSSCPAKYRLSDEGRRVAIECLSRSGMLDSTQSSVSRDDCLGSESQDVGIVEIVSADSPKEMALTPVDVSTMSRSRNDIPAESLERFTRLGYSRDQVLNAWADVSASSSNVEMSNDWVAVLSRLREDDIYGVQPKPQMIVGSSSGYAPNSNKVTEGPQYLTCGLGQTGVILSKRHEDAEIGEPSLRTETHDQTPFHSGQRASQNMLRMPKLKDHEKFEDLYEVILVLDDREQFTRSGMLESIRKEFKIKIEVRRLPVGDAIWIARHKQLAYEFVLNFIVERKNVDDLRSSIRDGRYKDQKLRLQRTGIKKIIYVVEGDPNTCDAADSIKTACFTTEILEGFDVQRTSGLKDTLRHYGFLTQAIFDLYKSDAALATECLNFRQFLKKCGDVDKMTVSDVFATQLTQVPQVTEDVAIAVLDCYPTLYSLATAYAHLDGNPRAQEELLVKKSQGAVSPAASKNIFRLIWAS